MRLKAGAELFSLNGVHLFLEILLGCSELCHYISGQYIHSPKEIKDHFEREEIIPDVLVYGPKRELKVKYGKQRCNFGTAYLPTEVKNPPVLGWDADKDALYTLLMIDPDVPNRKSPHLREYQHWLVVNIPENRTAEGQTLTEYLGIVPENTKTIHRYVLFVYKQPTTTPIEFDEPYKDKVPKNLVRGQFYTHRFSKKYKLGNPEFGNFFLSGPVYDPSKKGNIDPEYEKYKKELDIETVPDE